MAKLLHLVCAEQAISEHRRRYPDGGYEAANIALGGLRQVAAVLDPATLGLGNEETAALLRKGYGP